MFRSGYFETGRTGWRKIEQSNPEEQPLRRHSRLGQQWMATGKSEISTRAADDIGSAQDARVQDNERKSQLGLRVAICQKAPEKTHHMITFPLPACLGLREKSTKDWIAEVFHSNACKVLHEENLVKLPEFIL
jgi:hypothetical protein